MLITNELCCSVLPRHFPLFHCDWPLVESELDVPSNVGTYTSWLGHDIPRYTDSTAAGFRHILASLHER
jgi:hypothetical protein